MAKNKTTFTDSSVHDFIATLPNPVRRDDSLALLDLYTDLTGFPPVMYGPTIIGFGNYHYRYGSGHEGDAPLAAFAPRKDSLVLYFSVFDGREKLLAELGKHTSGKSCVYVKKLADIDIEVLKQLITACMQSTLGKYPKMQR